MSGWGEDDHGGLDDLFVPRDPATGDPDPTCSAAVGQHPTTIVLEGDVYDLIRYGDERVDGRDPFGTPCHICGTQPGKKHRRRCAMGSGHHRRPETCRDCGTAIGQVHHGDCVVERCPCCLGQLCSCDCECPDDIPLPDDAW